MALTDTTIRNAKPAARDYKIADSGGLFVLVTPAGGKLWRLKYRIDGKERKLALGRYPDISLSEARKRRDAAREQIALGNDPAREKQRKKIQAKLSVDNTFAAIAAEYCTKRQRDGERGWAPSTVIRTESLLKRLNASIGRLPISEIEPADVLAAVRKIEARGKLESARRTLQLASLVFRYAVSTARLTSDPTRDLRGALTAPTVTHYGAITETKRVGELLRAIDEYDGSGVTKLALQLAPHVFVRPGELRHADWSEIDLDAAIWAIPAGRTKMRKPHHVPLSRQVVALFHKIHEATGRKGYVFPSIRTRARPMSENTLNAALRRLGYASDEMTAHGFRAMASTLLNESGKWHPDAIERALAHGDSDKVRAAYHRGAHWDERVAMAQWWSDHLDVLRKGADVVPIRSKIGGE
ncbi:integrase arm-type DNA-binding domain-containing protein [Sphingopyxis sp. XHP0097]|uniref:Integrase arm-type DNA-binding domain-containing protein n=1 Tax=Sphingopyxis jiangsuensis TaxID=2871171 RepID=A0ABS7MC74_9SPHN|nr:integrase arm-type DNA-binding domain-containing protein [Sphingopyxis jiangsuensis]MBY4636568.1 integrase arm-type DNA-binding domain-containing protein [Sphingopyxis jiangsuensis]